VLKADLFWMDLRFTMPHVEECMFRLVRKPVNCQTPTFLQHSDDHVCITPTKLY